jgi:hypothetical protein
VGENAEAELVVIEKIGHAINAEKPKELYKNLNSFLVDPFTTSKQENHNNMVIRGSRKFKLQN